MPEEVRYHVRFFVYDQMDAEIVASRDAERAAVVTAAVRAAMRAEPEVSWLVDDESVEVERVA
ncbi:MAG: hypothetical protein KY455_08525 [Euryarchaeota archaeon]|nr:hypothetical protein [Euryarchaeota archaeon]